MEIIGIILISVPIGLMITTLSNKKFWKNF